MTRTRKIFTATIAAATLGLTVASSTPAAAWGWKHHHHYGYGAPIAAGVIGGLALGAMAASAAERDYDTCIARVPVTNSWGDVVGYRRARVAC